MKERERERFFLSIIENLRSTLSDREREKRYFILFYKKGMKGM
jgi:hypothetical protein